MRKKTKNFTFFTLMMLMVLLVMGCSSQNETTIAVPQSTSSQVATEAQTTQQATQPSKMKQGGGLGTSQLDTTAITRQFIGVAYNSLSAAQTLDIYLPNEGDGPFPVIVAIHGGAFKMGSSTGGDVAAMLEGVNQGYAVVSVNYRLSSEAVFPAAVNDCKAAIRFIKANASTYQLNADKIAVWGDSAGGNLAAMVGTTGTGAYLEDDNANDLAFTSEVQAVVNWFGPLEFLKMDEQFQTSGITPVFGATSSESSPESQYIGQLITKDPQLTQKANPGQYIDKLESATAPYFLMQHGTMDGNVPVQQSIDFADALIGQIGQDKVAIDLLEGAGHGTAEFTTQENLQRVFDFLDKALK